MGYKKLALITIIGMLVLSNYAYITNQRDQIEQLKARELTAQQATEMAYQDCQGLMAAERIMGYLNGCYNTVQIMCQGKEECVKFYAAACNVDNE